MTAPWLALALVAAVLGVAPLVLAVRFRRFVLRALAADPPPYMPRVSIILPCKGVDPDFEANLRSILQQDYPWYEVVVAVASGEDPALGVARRLAADSSVPVRVVVAGPASGRSQKVNNQLHALPHLDPTSEAIVCVDSDTRMGPHFLRHLVAPLTDPGVGMTTGYRWYHPPRPSLAGLLRSTWNGGALPLLIVNRYAFVFGGGMAIRREVFERARVAEAWEHAATDDFPMAGAVRRLGLSIRFVPQCLGVSDDEMCLGDVVAWTNRQTTICRVYRPALWWAITLGHAGSNLLMLLGLASAAGALLSGAAWLWWGALLLTPLVAEIADALLLLPVVGRMLPQEAATLRRRRWIYAALAPVASLLMVVNTVRSVLSNRIRWRGVTYELRGPSETVVHA